MHVNTEEESLRLPEEKVNNIRLLLKEPAYDAGNTQIALRDVQVLRGTLNFAAVTCPPILPELGAVDRLLRTVDGGPPGSWWKLMQNQKRKPKGFGETSGRRWKRFASTRLSRKPGPPTSARDSSRSYNPAKEWHYPEEPRS